MKLIHRAFVLPGFALLLAAAPWPSAGTTGRAQALVAEALKKPAAYSRLRVLTDTIGNRLAGSVAEPRAVAWGKAEFDKDGIAAHLEPVMVPVWVRGQALVELVTPVARPLVALALGGSVGTPPEGITARIVVVDSLEQLQALGAEKVRGKIVLFDNPFVRTGDEFADYGKAVKPRGSGATESAKLGAVAVLVRSVATASLSTPHTGALRYEDGVAKIPAAAVTIEDASLLHRLVESGGEVSVHLVLGCHTEPDRPGANVIAEIPGATNPEQVVLIVAHLDSWDVGQGAIDDGAGCAIVLEAMRLIAAGPHPRRTVRAMLAANEENGGRGGKGYLDAHKAELDRHVAAIETDSGAGRPLGLGIKAGPGGIEALRDLLAPTLAPIGARRFREGHGGSDIAPLEDYGVPLIGLELDGTRYFDWHHTQADTLDKVDPEELQLGVAAMAAAAWTLADAPVTLPRSPKKGVAVGGNAVLIPRASFFGNPAKDFPLISPSGDRLAWLAPSAQGVQNVWVRTLGRDDDVQVTKDNHAGIIFYRWAADGRHLLFMQDSDGDENFHVFSIDLDTRDIRDLTPFAGVKAQNLLVSATEPREILVGLNRRDRRLFDMYRVDLETGAVSLDTQNPGDVLGWATDTRFVIRAATVFDPAQGRTVLRVRDAANKPWRDLTSWPFEQSSMFGQVNGGSVVAGFTPDGNALYVASATGFDTSRLVKLDAATGRQLQVVAEDPRADVEQDALGFNVMRPAVVFSPITQEIQAVEFDYMKPEWKVIDPSVKADFELLGGAHRGTLLILSRDAADQRWIVSHAPDNGPRIFSLYDRKSRQLQRLFVDHPELEKLTLASVAPVEIPARDGQRLVAYLTLPIGAEGAGGAGGAKDAGGAGVASNAVKKPREGRDRLPMVLFPHGGPWARDIWGFDPVAQWLASRGYVVLQVNFRGSTGFGKKFLNASTGQWGVGAMQDDLTDSVKWAIAKGIADPARVGIMGYSYGGYATLSGLTFTPDLYACGVDIVGPSDVAALFASIPDSWAPVKKRWILRVGDVEHDTALNQRISPLYHVDRIRAPLLIGHGANDPRVNLESSNRIVAALRDKKLPVTYIVYPDEGHGFGRPENNLDFFGRAEEFLAQCLGGRAEPWVRVEGSTAEIR